MPKAERGAWEPAPERRYLVSPHGVIVLRGVVGGDKVIKKKKISKQALGAPSYPQS